MNVCIVIIEFLLAAMRGNHNAFIFTRFTLWAICIMLFILHSYQEIDKFFKKLTSTAIRTEIDESARYPTIVVCLKEAFKVGVYPKTLEDFNKLTYNKEEIFNSDTQVFEIATFWYGKCFQLDIPANFTYKDWVYMGVITKKQLFVHFVDHGQEVCLIYGYCQEEHETITLEHYVWSVIYLKGRRKVHEQR